METRTSFCIILTVLFLAVTSAAKLGYEDPCGGFIESNGGTIDTFGSNEMSSNVTCVWIIKSLTKMGIDFHLEALPEGSTLMVYKEGHKGSPPELYKKFTDFDAGMGIHYITGETLLIILPKNRGSDEVRFSWSSWRIYDADEQRSVNFALSHQGEQLWTEFQVPHKLLWALSPIYGQDQKMTVNVQTAFPTTEATYPCYSTYFGLYEILPSGLIQEVITVCSRPLKIEANGLIPPLLAFSYVDPGNLAGSGNLETFVDLKWSVDRTGNGRQVNILPWS